MDDEDDFHIGVLGRIRNGGDHELFFFKNIVGMTMAYLSRVSPVNGFGAEICTMR